jgi:tetratricopeptide (TPR) repeat protein
VAVVAAACSSSPSSDTNSAAAKITAGLQAQHAGNNQEALNDFKAAIAKDPANAYAYYDLGVVYQENLHDSTDAINAYNKAILAKPDYKPALFNLAILQTPSNPQAAISTYQQLLALNKNDANVLFNLGLLLIAQGQTQQGQADVSKAVFINPALKSRVPAGVTP